MTLDGKGRFAVPTRYRDALGGEGASLVVTIDTSDPCLLIYPTQAWHVIEEHVQQLPSFNAAARRIQRLLIGHATDVELDTSGRVLLPPLLRDYAHLEKNVVLIGQGNKFELWSEEEWQTRRAAWLLMDTPEALSLPDELKTFSL